MEQALFIESNYSYKKRTSVIDNYLRNGMNYRCVAGILILNNRRLLKWLQK